MAAIMLAIAARLRDWLLVVPHLFRHWQALPHPGAQRVLGANADEVLEDHHHLPDVLAGVPRRPLQELVLGLLTVVGLGLLVPLGIGALLTPPRIEAALHVSPISQDVGLAVLPLRRISVVSAVDERNALHLVLQPRIDDVERVPGEVREAARPSRYLALHLLHGHLPEKALLGGEDDVDAPRQFLRRQHRLLAEVDTCDLGHVAQDLAVGVLAPAGDQRQHPDAVGLHLVPRRRVLDHVAGNKRDIVLTKELLGSETAGSARVPVDPDLPVVGLSGGHVLLLAIRPTLPRFAGCVQATVQQIDFDTVGTVPSCVPNRTQAAVTKRIRSAATSQFMRAYGETTLDSAIRSRQVDNTNGLSMHVLEAGEPAPGRPTLLLLHGFPELAYSWRKVIVPLADAGFHVIAPDQRGYGRTTGSDDRYDCDLADFRMINLARDTVGLLAALGIDHVRAVIGHDFGSSLAAWCAMLRPDIFRACALMSAPYSGPPALPFDTAARTLTDAEKLPAVTRIQPALAALPEPRQHYHAYYSTRDANPNMQGAPQGVHDFLRAYYHQKSADWPGNQLKRLKAWTAEELAQLPHYYVMQLGKGMAETVAPHLPSREEIARCRWLTEDELAVYAAEYQRRGFQGGLNWYRARLAPRLYAQDQLFSGCTIDVPCTFIAGAHDWGVYQTPGSLEKLEATFAPDYRGTHLIPAAGHWVQQEQPETVVHLLLDFVARA